MKINKLQPTWGIITLINTVTKFATGLGDTVILKKMGVAYHIVRGILLNSPIKSQIHEQQIMGVCITVVSCPDPAHKIGKGAWCSEEVGHS